MAKLYFRYGAMGSSKTANALMVHYNYLERGSNAVLLKPKLENRDGEKIIKSRIGLESECDYVEDFMEGTITREAFWVLAKFKYPTHQIVFCTQESLRTIKFERSIQL